MLEGIQTTQLVVKISLPVGLLAQLIEHCSSITEVMGLSPVRAWIFSGIIFATSWVVFITARIVFIRIVKLITSVSWIYVSSWSKPEESFGFESCQRCSSFLPLYCWEINLHWIFKFFFQVKMEEYSTITYKSLISFSILFMRFWDGSWSAWSELGQLGV